MGSTADSQCVCSVAIDTLLRWECCSEVEFFVKIPEVELLVRNLTQITVNLTSSYVRTVLLVKLIL
jgi:hypothetical protein